MADLAFKSFKSMIIPSAFSFNYRSSSIDQLRIFLRNLHQCVINPEFFLQCLSRFQDNCPQWSLSQDNWPFVNCPPENCSRGKLPPPTIPTPTSPPNDCPLDDCPQGKLHPRKFVPPPHSCTRGKLPPCTIFGVN